MRMLAIQLQTDDYWHGLTESQVAAHYDRAFTLLEHGAALYRPDVILFPEAFAAYCASTDMRPFAEEVPGPTTDRFCRYSSRYNAMILFGLIRRAPSGEGLYNSVVIADQGKILGIYDKTHLCMDHSPETRALKNEQEKFIPGDRLGLFDTRFGKIGVMVCHDGDYPEVPRALVLEGAKAIFWLMNTADRSAMARLYAYWNATPVFTCNRVIWSTCSPEVEDGRRRGGGSVFIDVHGEPFDIAGTAEAFVFAEVDLDEQAAFRAEGITSEANVFRVRRTDLYGSLARTKQTGSKVRCDA